MQEKWWGISNLSAYGWYQDPKAPMKKLIVLFIILAFMFIGYLLNNWLQQIVQPRRSFGRLVLYFLTVLASVFALSFLMVWVIMKLYPNELMK